MLEVECGYPFGGDVFCAREELHCLATTLIHYHEYGIIFATSGQVGHKVYGNTLEGTCGWIGVNGK